MACSCVPRRFPRSILVLIIAISFGAEFKATLELSRILFQIKTVSEGKKHKLTKGEIKYKQVFHFFKMYSNAVTLQMQPRVDGACCGRSNSVLVLSLPLCFVVVGVAAVQLIEHLSDSHLQSGCQKLDILLHTEVQYPIDPLCQVQLNVWLQCNLERQKKRAVMEKAKKLKDK